MGGGGGGGGYYENYFIFNDDSNDKYQMYKPFLLLGVPLGEGLGDGDDVLSLPFLAVVPPVTPP